MHPIGVCDHENATTDCSKPDMYTPVLPSDHAGRFPVNAAGPEVQAAIVSVFLARVRSPRAVMASHVDTIPAGSSPLP